jgi:hypothetical protein
MQQITKRLSLTAGLVVLTTALGLLNTGSVGAASTPPSIPVTVQNTPLPVQGNVNATVTNTPTVRVNTTPTTPIYVDADGPARNGFNVSCFTGNVDSAGQASCHLLSIPAGKQVVIETISCQAETYTGEGPADVQLVIPNTPAAGGPDPVSHFLTLTKQDSAGNLDIWRMTTPLRAYGSAPAAGAVNIDLFYRANSAHLSITPQDLFCAISGYMVGQ